MATWASRGQAGWQLTVVSGETVAVGRKSREAQDGDLGQTDPHDG